MKWILRKETGCYALIYLFILSGINNPVSAQRIISLSEYGVVPNSFQNATPNIARAIQAAKGADSCIIKFPGGRLDLWPEGASKKIYYISNSTVSDTLPKVRTIGMLFKDLDHVTLEGNNTLLVFHGKMNLMTIDHCRDFKVEGLRFDYQRPAMSEMTIVSKTDSDVIADINPGSWYAVENHHQHPELIWYGEGWRTYHAFMAGYRPALQTMYYSRWAPFKNSNAKTLSPFKVKFTGRFKNTNFEAGDILSIRDPYRDEVGIFNTHSHNITFKNLKFYYIHGLGIVSQLSKNITINQVNVTPRPGSGRVIAAFADCFQFSSCYGQVKIENCKISGTHDDPINIHGTYLRVMKAKGQSVIVRFMQQATWGFNAFEAGDSIEFVHHNTLLGFGKAIVLSSKMISKKEIKLVLNKPVPKGIQENDCIGDISKTPSVIIRDNYFQHVLTRGILVTTRRKILIEKNTFYRVGLHAILIADDANSWFESGPVRNVTIRNNKFLDCAYRSSPDCYVIAIKPETTGFKQSKYVHSNIRILDNTFQIFDDPVLFARDVKGLTFVRNKIIYRQLQGFPAGNKPAFNMDHCTDVLIQHNSFKGGPLRKRITISHMKKSVIKYEPAGEFNIVEKKKK